MILIIASLTLYTFAAVYFGWWKQDCVYNKVIFQNWWRTLYLSAAMSVLSLLTKYLISFKFISTTVGPWIHSDITASYTEKLFAVAAVLMVIQCVAWSKVTKAKDPSASNLNVKLIKLTIHFLVSAFGVFYLSQFRVLDRGFLFLMPSSIYLMLAITNAFHLFEEEAWEKFEFDRVLVTESGKIISKKGDREEKIEKSKF